MLCVGWRVPYLTSFFLRVSDVLQQQLQQPLQFNPRDDVEISPPLLG